MGTSAGVVVVGGSIAAVTAAESARLVGYDGPITIVSDEFHDPYSRPPLSKAVLAKRDTMDTIAIPRSAEGVTLRKGARAVRLDRDARRVHLADGDTVAYERLVIATGGRARTVRPDGPQERVLRDFDDAERLAGDLEGAASLLVVGGGFIGMEVASVAVSAGISVTVVDREIPLRRQFGPFLSDWMVRRATDAGVRIVVASDGGEIVGRDVAEGYRLSDGSTLSADVVLSAVGCRPNIEWLRGSGILSEDGLVVDDNCMVTPEIAACGDVVSTLDPGVGRTRRTPFWGTALDQARTAGRSIVRGPDTAADAGSRYFWTEQFGLNLKIVGDLPLIGTPTVVEGSIGEGSAILQWNDAAGRPVAAASVNRRTPIRKLREMSSSRSTATSYPN